jgi:hypothetical protein
MVNAGWIWIDMVKEQIWFNIRGCRRSKYGIKAAKKNNFSEEIKLAKNFRYVTAFRPIPSMHRNRRQKSPFLSSDGRARRRTPA